MACGAAEIEVSRCINISRYIFTVERGLGTGFEAYQGHQESLVKRIKVAY